MNKKNYRTTSQVIRFPEKFKIDGDSQKQV